MDEPYFSEAGGSTDQCPHRTRAQEETVQAGDLSQKLSVASGSWVSSGLPRFPWPQQDPKRNLIVGELSSPPSSPYSSSFLLYGFPSSRPALVREGGP